MLFVGNEYIVKFPMGGKKVMTLNEVHNPQQPHEPLYTFIDSSNIKVKFSKSVCSRITFQYNINLPPVPRYLQHNFHLPPVQRHLLPNIYNNPYQTNSLDDLYK